MKLHNLHPSAPKQKRKRVGRGDSSGLGGTCGRGEKGQKSRSGSGYRAYFEGGQIPLFRRLPKRGFNSPNHKSFNIINIATLEENFAANDVVDEKLLREKGFIGKSELDLKILANGEITKPLTVRANKFSASAKEKIEAAGGKCELI
jgi:large subunit ribosomal protein L15